MIIISLWTQFIVRILGIKTRVPSLSAAFQKNNCTRTDNAVRTASFAKRKRAVQLKPLIEPLPTCNFKINILEGGALSPPECRLRHSSDRQKPALMPLKAAQAEFTTPLAWQRFDKARNKARDKDCSTKSYTLHRHGHQGPKPVNNFLKQLETCL
jgi:hypothetical protein